MTISIPTRASDRGRRGRESGKQARSCWRAPSSNRGRDVALVPQSLGKLSQPIWRIDNPLPERSWLPAWRIHFEKLCLLLRSDRKERLAEGPETASGGATHQ